MGLKGVLARLASGAPVPVFAVAGLGASEQIQELLLDDRLRLVDTPRAALILVVAGAIPDELTEPLARLHDSIPHPRCTVWWPLGAPPTSWLGSFPHHVVIEDQVPGRLTAIQRELLRGQRRSEPPILPDVDAAPWRGVGPYGQGGTGMTGGTPYGRPMAELAPDRDGLRLDLVPLRVGPFFPRFPAGLTLEAKLAGDVIVEASIPGNPFAAAGLDGPTRPGLRPFIRALSEPVPVAELELARTGEHLRWLADALAASELRSLGLRVLRLAASIGPADVDSVRSLTKAIGRTQAFGWSTGGVGRIGADVLEGLGAGPVGRAAGLAEDARADDPAYRDLGFEPILHTGGDSAARWRQRLAEAAQSLELAGRAGGRRTTPIGSVESPRGRLEPNNCPAARLLPLVPRLIEGMEWGDAVTTLISLDFDLEEAVAVEQLSGKAVAS